MVKLLPLNGHVLVRCHRRFNHNQSSSLSLSFKPCFFNPIIFLQNLKTLLSVTSIERSYLWSLHVCLGLTSPLLETSCPMITTIGLDSPLKSMSNWWESGSRKETLIIILKNQWEEKISIPPSYTWLISALLKKSWKSLTWPTL